MHNRDEVYHCVGHCVCARAVWSPQFDSESRKKERFAKSGGRKEETEFPGCKRRKVRGLKRRQ